MRHLPFYPVFVQVKAWWGIHRPSWFPQKKWKLPDSWFTLAISLALAIATFGVERFVSGFGFWQTSNTKHVALTLSQVTIHEYRDGRFWSLTQADNLTMDSQAKQPIGAQKATTEFEHWQMKNWALVSLDNSGQKLYTLHSPLANLWQEADYLLLDNTLQIRAYYLPSLLPYLALTTPKGEYHINTRELVFPERVDLNIDGNSLSGANMRLNLADNHLSLARVRGVIHTAANINP